MTTDRGNLHNRRANESYAVSCLLSGIGIRILPALSGWLRQSPRNGEGVRKVRTDTTVPMLQLQGITKRFGELRAVDNLSLDIRHGEVVALLGPSGCGKSTTLRQIAGLDEPDIGVITLSGRTLYSSYDGIFVPPQKRNMGMVFQSYAIWPHLTVAETIAYPLRLRRVPASEIRQAVERALAQVGLSGLADRPATNLSGGQQQRVALARALVYEPEVLLLDEPFSNLDDKLRKQMRIELKILQRKVGVTVVLVTHDQSEALSLSDRVAVMNSGRIEQMGPPLELYSSPKTSFVRDFIGQTTKLPVTIGDRLSGDGTYLLQVAPGLAPLRCRTAIEGDISQGERAVACIRPESIRLGSSVDLASGNVVEAVVDALLFLGNHYECVLDVAGVKLMAIAPRSEPLREGEKIPLEFPEEALSIWRN